MFRNKTATQHNFALVPGVQTPRSKFLMRQTRKQAFDASDLIPIMCEEVLPGDTWQHTESILARLATPIAPLIDDLYLETWYFWVPNRITSKVDDATVGQGRNQWEALITGTADLTVPLLVPPEDSGSPGHWPIPVGSVLDHFGIPPANYTNRLFFNALPVWAYFTIYNEFFRDQNLQEFQWQWDHSYSNTQDTDMIFQDTTPDPVDWDMMPLRVNKLHDYFTGSLPFAQKGDPVTIALGNQAPVKTAATDLVTGIQEGMQMLNAADGSEPTGRLKVAGGQVGHFIEAAVDEGRVYPSNLYADLSAASAVTINDLKLASVMQQLLERDARSGSRYVENLLGHWGVRLPDYTAQRPEYLGGSKIPITVNPIAQTAAYDAEPADSPSAVGNLGAEMHASGSKRTFTHSAHEHGYIIGLCAVRAKPTYQQGIRRHWQSRSTRWDFWDPMFSNLGEQQVYTSEIYIPGNTLPVTETWGYQEQGAEYRYTPNEITGVLRSTVAQPLDWWHLAEEFAGEPALNDLFITDKTKETLARCLATAPSAQWSAQIIMDILHESNVMRLMPAYSVPGIDRL